MGLVGGTDNSRGMLLWLLPLTELDLALSEPDLMLSGGATLGDFGIVGLTGMAPGSRNTSGFMLIVAKGSSSYGNPGRLGSRSVIRERRGSLILEESKIEA